MKKMTEETVGTLVKRLVRLSGLSHRSFANSADINPSTLTRAFRAITTDDLNEDTLRGIAAASGKSLPELMAFFQNELDPRPPVIPDRIPGNFTIRFVSDVGADGGTDFEVDTWSKEGVPGYLYPYPQHEPMAMRVRGTSMENAKDADSIYEGDFVIFANALDEPVGDGEIVIAYHPGLGAKVVKRLRRLPKGKVQLMPLNEKEKPLPPMEESDVILRPVKVIVHNVYRKSPAKAGKKVRA